MPTCPIPRELVSHAAASRAALQRPLQPLFARRAHLLRAAAERLQPMRDDVEVLVLVEGIERDPQSEALGERNLLLDRLAGMDFIADILGLEVFSHVLGHQVAAVRRDRKSTRLNSSHSSISYAVFCLKKKKK